MAKDLIERSAKAKSLMLEKGIGQGQALQLLPRQYQIAAIAHRHQVSEPTLRNVKRLTDAIDFQLLPNLETETA